MAITCSLCKKELTRVNQTYTAVVTDRYDIIGEDTELGTVLIEYSKGVDESGEDLLGYYCPFCHAELDHIKFEVC